MKLSPSFQLLALAVLARSASAANLVERDYDSFWKSQLEFIADIYGNPTCPYEDVLGLPAERQEVALDACDKYIGLIFDAGEKALREYYHHEDFLEASLWYEIHANNLLQCIALTHKDWLEMKRKCDEAICKGDADKLKKASEERQNAVKIAFERCPKLVEEYKKLAEEGYVVRAPDTGGNATRTLVLGTRTMYEMATSATGTITFTVDPLTVPTEAWAFTTQFKGPIPTEKPESAASSLSMGGMGAMAVVGLTFAYTLMGALV